MAPLQHRYLLDVIVLSQTHTQSRQISSLSTHWKTTYAAMELWTNSSVMEPRQRYLTESRIYSDTTPLRTGRVNPTISIRTRLNVGGESSNLWLTWCSRGQAHQHAHGCWFSSMLSTSLIEQLRHLSVGRLHLKSWMEILLTSVPSSSINSGNQYTIK